MDPPVTLQQPLLSESFVADLTFVGFRSFVSSDVSVAAVGGKERLPTDVRAARSLVSLKMVPQLLCRLRMFSTHSTEPLWIAHVAPGVFDQHAGGRSQSWTDPTDLRGVAAVARPLHSHTPTLDSLLPRRLLTSV